MNRGYYARMQSMNKILNTFLETTNSGHRQIINLGSGFDSSSLLPYSQGYERLRTFEVDFATIITKKTEILLSIPAVVTLLCGDQTSGSASLTSSEHKQNISSSVCRIGPVSFISQDLRNAQSIVSDLLVAGLDVSQPTLVISECVLVYVNKEHVSELCSALGAFLQGPAAWLTYDMVHPQDLYGATMARNLKAMGFHIPGFADYPSLEAQRQRFLETGWSECGSSSMLRFYDTQVRDALSEAEQRRVAQIEVFDEFEEWNLLMGHYSLTVSLKRSSGAAEGRDENAQQSDGGSVDEELARRLMSFF